MVQWPTAPWLRLPEASRTSVGAVELQWPVPSARSKPAAWEVPSLSSSRARSAYGRTYAMMACSGARAPPFHKGSVLHGDEVAWTLQPITYPALSGARLASLESVRESGAGSILSAPAWAHRQLRRLESRARLDRSDGFVSVAVSSGHIAVPSESGAVVGKWRGGFWRLLLSLVLTPLLSHFAERRTPVTSPATSANPAISTLPESPPRGSRPHVQACATASRLTPLAAATALLREESALSALRPLSPGLLLPFFGTMASASRVLGGARTCATHDIERLGAPPPDSQGGDHEDARRGGGAPGPSSCDPRCLRAGTSTAGWVRRPRFFRSVLRSSPLHPPSASQRCGPPHCYVAFMEGYAGLWPDVDFWSRLFYLKTTEGRLRTCGAASIYPRTGTSFPRIPTVDSVKNWQMTFFYVKNANPAFDRINLYDPAPPTTRLNWGHNASRHPTWRSSRPEPLTLVNNITKANMPKPWQRGCRLRPPHRPSDFPRQEIEDGDLAHKIWTPDLVDPADQAGDQAGDDDLPVVPDQGGQGEHNPPPSPEQREEEEAEPATSTTGPTPIRASAHEAACRLGDFRAEEEEAGYRREHGQAGGPGQATAPARAQEGPGDGRGRHKVYPGRCLWAGCSCCAAASSAEGADAAAFDTCAHAARYRRAARGYAASRGGIFFGCASFSAGPGRPGRELEPAELRRLRSRRWFPPGQPRRPASEPPRTEPQREEPARAKDADSQALVRSKGPAVSPTSLHVAKGARLVSVPSASDSSFGSAGTMEKAWHQADSCEIISREGQPGTAPLKMLFSGYRASLKNKAAEVMAQLSTLEDADKVVDERRTALYNKVVTSYHKAKIERATLARELEAVKVEAAKVPQLERDLRVARAQCAESEEAGRAAAAKLKVADGELTRLRALEKNHLAELASLRTAEKEKVEDLSRRLAEVEKQRLALHRRRSPPSPRS
ncbi:hypothetical protein QYE76_041382 [Lolium multiflorum]|uniref:Uncharacterized protein n=1 Tax=Lolium multiflorum TaxID=4521 RepID=A0AAD8TEV5_LOLMU|nr:hypothetical protein QYE76_041382 [Lolium multiflorum]